MNSEEQWTTIIKPKTALWEIDFKELWQYKGLWSMYVKRDIITQYKQTILGPLWFIIQPALTTIMYMVVFGGIAGIATDGIPQPLFYLAGICMWQYFADCLTHTSSTFLSNANIFGKVYFPRLIAPLATITGNLVKFIIQLTLFAVVYIYFVFKGMVVAINWYACLLPVLILVLAGLALSFGIVISSLTTKYRDLTYLFSFLIQLWMYATPIVYPLSRVEGVVKAGINVHSLMCLNPVTPIIEAFKYGFLGEGMLDWGWLAYSFVFMIVLLTIGIMLFNKVQRSFMDTV